MRILSFILIFFSFVFPALADDEDVFMVKDVKVYAESDTLDNARREALNNGIKTSFEVVLKRILPSSLHWKLDQIKSEKAYDTLKSYEAKNERMTSSSYMADVNIKFNEDEITKQLNFIGAKYAVKYSDKFLVIPNLMTKYQPIMSEEWDSVWENAPDDFGLLRFTYSINDLEDFYILSNLNKDTINIELLSPLFEKYDATAAILINANIKRETIEVEIVELKKTSVDQLKLSYEIDKEIGKKENYKKLMLTIFELLDERYKGIDKFKEPEQFRSRLIAKIKEAKDWSTIRENIEFVNGVQDVEIIKMNKDSVVFDLVYNVEPEFISQNLKKDGFKLYENKGIQFVEMDLQKPNNTEE